MPLDLSALIDALRHRPIVERIEAARNLSQAGPAAAPAALPLLEAVGDEEEELQQWASAALEELGPPEIKDRDPLARRLSDPNDDRAYWAATLLGRLGPAAAPTLPALEAAARTASSLSVRQQAVWAIGQLDAASVLRAEGTLREATNSKDRRLSRLAQEALEMLQTRKPPPNQR